MPAPGQRVGRWTVAAFPKLLGAGDAADAHEKNPAQPETVGGISSCSIAYCRKQDTRECHHDSAEQGGPADPDPLLPVYAAESAKGTARRRLARSGGRRRRAISSNARRGR